MTPGEIHALRTMEGAFDNRSFQLKYLSEDARLLGQFVRGSDEAAGYDIKAIVPVGMHQAIHPGETFFFKTGAALWINNPGYVGMVYVRSSIGCKRGLVLANGTGVIDSDYQGEWIVALRNVTREVRLVEHGERIAQVVFQCITHPQFTPVEEFGANTIRGAGGLGSTGVK